MPHWKVIAAIGLTLALCAPPASARRHRGHARNAEPDSFDYYVLSLSWSPQHCANRDGGPNDPQCGAHRQYGFVVHGLWPQHDRGFPESCGAGGTLDQAVVESMLDIMPSPQLIRHEWTKHGTCSGMDAPSYFAKMRSAYTGLKIPAPYQKPHGTLHVPASQIKQEFAHANPGIDGTDLAVLCSGKFLQEVRVCFDKNLHPRDCGHDVRDRCRDEVIVRPVR